MSVAGSHSGQPLIVTIDGPAGTGKSTVGRELARRLGLEFLDTGAMYRGATALVLDRGIDPENDHAVAAAVAAAKLRFDWTADPPTLICHEKPLTDRLRQTDVADLISALAAQAQLRAVMVELQRAIGRAHPRLVTEGRDQGSVVFPDAQVKIYLHASPRVRAERRAGQFESAGQVVDVNEIEQELIRRDERDANRAVGPLVRPDGAIDVDTSELTFDESLDVLESIVRDQAPHGALEGAANRHG